MLPLRNQFVWLLAMQTVSTTQSCTNNLQPVYSAPVVGNGWIYGLVVNDLRTPRSILVDGEGALLVLDAGVGIKRLTLRDEGATCLSRQEETTLVESSELNHGLALSSDGQMLYASTSDKVYAWPYNAEEGRVMGGNTTVIEGMFNGGHSTRTLLISKKSPGMLVVSRGSDGNVDALCRDESSGHCQIRAFNASNQASGRPFNFTTDGIRLGWGLRNFVGLAEDPAEGGIWSVENSVDNLERAGQDIHRDNPGEELNFHGYLNASDEATGGNYGYPECLALWSTDNFPGRGDLATGDQFNAEGTGAERLNDSLCSVEQRIAPRLTFQAHTAPLDILFTPDGSEALVTFHGSWNRDDPVGYKLSSIAFHDGSPREPGDSRTAAIDVLSNAALNDCPGRCFRPVGLAWDSQERLFVTSDSTGEIYVLVRSTTETGSHPSPTSKPDDSAGLQSPALALTILVAVAVAIAGQFYR